MNFTFNWSELSRSGEPPPRGGTILDARRSTDFDPTLSGKSGDRVRKHIGLAFDSNQNYTGARAAFEVFGDCELSRCFLRDAVEKNPIIYRRILGRADPPGKIASGARDFKTS